TGWHKPQAKFLEIVNVSHGNRVALQPFSQAGQMGQPEVARHHWPPQITIEEQYFLPLLAGQRDGQVGGNHALAFFRYGAGNQELLEGTRLLHLPQAHCEETELFGGQAFFVGKSYQAALLRRGNSYRRKLLHLNRAILRDLSLRKRLNLVNGLSRRGDNAGEFEAENLWLRFLQCFKQ